MKRSDYRPYLRTLRRVPDDVILAVATRDLNLNSPRQCVCGWVLREAFARMADKTADDVLLVADHSLDILNPLAELQLENMRTAEGLDLASAWARFLGEPDDN